MKKALLAYLLLCIVSCEKHATAASKQVDVLLIGAGIMSATLGALLYELDPNLSIEVFERLPKIAEESSGVWNNAGTGHAGHCELNYTPELEDGSLDMSKAVKINEAFEMSLEFWAYQIQQNKILSAQSFLNRVPHISFVWGEKNIAALKKRYELMKQHPYFEEMEFTDDFETMETWSPLIIEGRNKQKKIAATRVKHGTDVNFEVLSRGLFASLARSRSNAIHLQHEVVGLEKNKDSTWTVAVRNLKTRELSLIQSKFVLIGAGGGSLPLLQKSKIPEGLGYGGVPVGGQWLISGNKDLIERHQAKVYGKAPVGSPPMSVPHLDTRYIDGKRMLLFGPFATFSTKFLKQGSWFDMPLSFNLGNLIPMIESGVHNIPLTQYLLRQLFLTPRQRLANLKEYFPNAKLEDWHLQSAGQRVQVIKNDPVKGGILQFGTELIISEDGSLAALLGASPGASIAVDTMLKVLEKSFKESFQSKEWQSKLKSMIPSYGLKLSEHSEYLLQLRKKTREDLGLNAAL